MATASNQPQRRGRPVVAPNSWPRPDDLRPVVADLGRERPPTRVMYALAMPTACANPVGTDAQAGRERAGGLLEDVTNG